MITYKKAMEIVAKEFKSDWQYGTFYADSNGYENSKFFMVPYGAKEFFIDDDEEFFLQDLPVALVDKKTGDLQLRPVIESFDLVNSLNPV